jgi:DNA-binding CsgD family transcriptional regulator
MTATVVHGDGQAGRGLFSQDVWFQISNRLSLSERELQIVQGVFDDQHENQIAQELEISSHTVHTHLERLYHKLGVSSRVELVVRIVKCHLHSCLKPDSSVSCSSQLLPLCLTWLSLS